MSAQLSYKTLRAENSAEFVINKSRFIGYGCPCETEEEALVIARKLEYPVIIKASAGGGGRGILLI